MLLGMAYAYPPQQAYAMRTTAPASLHVVAIFQYLGGLLMLGIAALFALAASEMTKQLGGRLGTYDASVTSAVAVVVAVFAGVGLIAIILGRKVQRGRNWARILLTVLNVLSLASVAWQAYSTSLLTVSTIVSAAFPALFLILLNTRAARSWCHHRTY
ncbi:hypothetical protein GCM10009827_005050 [Dactylosporangium maewongense]|uniref:Uncharacterized protein n=2 Tax=Micromonosporaceae TaxID=28056 RepID=A0ABP4KDU0_9ACTN